MFDEFFQRCEMEEVGNLDQFYNKDISVASVIQLYTNITTIKYSIVKKAAQLLKLFRLFWFIILHF